MRLILVGLCSAAMLTAGEDNVLAQPVGQADMGEELYLEFCERCHGIDKVGLEWIPEAFAELRDLLTGNSLNMPDFSVVLSEKDFSAIHAYLHKPMNN